MTAAYLHIPFCMAKCLYCAFDSLPKGRWDDGFMAEYEEALLKEIKSKSSSGYASPLSSVYFGGGTPSLMKPSSIARILNTLADSFGIMDGCEISMELNPGTCPNEGFKKYRKAGINRLSIGGQSFDDGVLKQIGRIHSSETLERAIESALSAGFDSVSLDLIFGFPNYVRDILMSDMEKAVSSGISHLSFYMFTPEEGTPLGDAVLSEREELPSDESLASMMDDAHSFLVDKGFIHYEISNFSKPGFECRHNMRYWNYGDYFGFGSSACSFLGGVRIKNNPDPFSYRSKIACGKSPHVYAEKLSRDRSAGEYVMLALRTARGIDSSDFKRRFGMDFSERFKKETEFLLCSGELKRDGNFYFVPYEFFSVQSGIASMFL